MQRLMCGAREADADMVHKLRARILNEIWKAENMFIRPALKIGRRIQSHGISRSHKAGFGLVECFGGSVGTCWWDLQGTKQASMGSPRAFLIET